MKKLLIALFILSSTAMFAQGNRDNRDNRNRNPNRDMNQNTNVPVDIQRSFQRDYPDAQNPQWNNSNGQWHGTYRDQNNRTVETHYNSNGQRIDTHIPYTQNEVPSRVRDRADKKYHANNNYYRIERPNAQPLYQVRTQKGRNIYMDENGKKRRYRDHH